MTATLLGAIKWEMDRDDDGHREYTLTTLIETSDANDGPTTVMLCPGLPLPGSQWIMGNDVDLAAYCRPSMGIAPVIENEPNTYWIVSQTFSTRPLNRCSELTVENPLLEPPKISGSAVKRIREKYTHYDGGFITNSANQLVHGDAVEIDDPRPTVNISINKPTAELSGILALLKNPLNDSPMWGLPARCIKFSDWTWEKHYYGFCNSYYTHNFGFEVDWETFDRWYPDIGTRYIRDAGPPILYAPATTEEGYIMEVLLDGAGGILDPSSPLVELKSSPLGQSNLMLMGLPAFL